MSATRENPRPGPGTGAACAWQRVVTAVVVVSLTLLQGCATTYLPARSHTPLAEQLDVGDRVRVTTVDGVKSQFAVTKVDPDGLYDEDEYYRFEDLTEIMIEQRSAGTSASTIAIVGIVAGVIIILAIVNGVEDSVEGALD